MTTVYFPEQGPPPHHVLLPPYLFDPKAERIIRGESLLYAKHKQYAFALPPPPHFIAAATLPSAASRSCSFYLPL